MGFSVLLKPQGVATFEFPHLVNLVEKSQFDTIYHEHFSYLSFYSVKTIFENVGLEMFDVEELSTHGGSLRIYAKPEINTLSVSFLRTPLFGRISLYHAKTSILNNF